MEDSESTNKYFLKKKIEEEEVIIDKSIYCILVGSDYICIWIEYNLVHAFGYIELFRLVNTMHNMPALYIYAINIYYLFLFFYTNSVLNDVFFIYMIHFKCVFINL